MSNDTPLVPRVGEVHYLVLDDLGRYGRVYRETKEREADEAKVVTYILDGQYKKPVRVIAFDLSAGWVRDATADVALAVLKRARSEHRLIGIRAGEFIELALGPNAAE